MSSSSPQPVPNGVPSNAKHLAAKHANGSVASATPEVLETEAKYKQESEKRLRRDGLSQFVDIETLDRFAESIKAAWPDPKLDNAPRPLVDGSRCGFLIVGAGYGGLMTAARLMKAGVPSGDIRFVDTAGGFGGSWWLNRYPGLMCDIESYIYMPLLEETNYMPKHKYSYAPELRSQAERIAEQYGLTNNALFRVKVDTLTWDESAHEWVTRLESLRPGEEQQKITVRSRFTILSTGTLNWPKIPKVPGLEKFQGHTFHTSVWDYEYTGGSEADPRLTNLQNKRVGIIGTGATAIQVVPELAKWAKELYVFQRTPSAVDIRGQKETDPTWWKEQTAKAGWQRERRLNFSKYTSDEYPRPEIDLVDDQWTKFPSYSALIGGPNAPRKPEEVPGYVAKLKQMDLVRQSRVRARVDEIVTDTETANSLKAWYPGWCKRPCFHDDYLQSFNQPNVTLVNTDGRGVDAFNETGLVCNGQEFPIDVLIFSTGYEIQIAGSPAGRAHMNAIGLHGKTLDQKWKEGVATLYGLQSNGFPNLFWMGLGQTSLTANQTWILDELSEHLARIFEALLKEIPDAQRGGSDPVSRYPFTVEPTHEAEEKWTSQIVERAGAFATLSSCPPSYFNAEGELLHFAGMSPEALQKQARGSTWGTGFADFLDNLSRWTCPNVLNGLDFNITKH